MGEENVTMEKEAETVDLSELEAKIIRQIEYYFGDYNLTRDKFLREQIGLEEGWVPLETMIKFNRLKKICDDYAVIIAALKKSPTQLMEVHEDGTKIRRQTAKPLPEDSTELRSERDERTLYVKGFSKSTTLDELLEFFKPYNSEHILMRRRPQGGNRVFKGSLFVTFVTKDDAEKFLENKSVKYNGIELLKEIKNDYVQRKDKEIKTHKEEKAKKLLLKASGEKNDETTEVPEIEVKEGCCLKITGLEKDTSREHIKKALEPYEGTIVFVDYSWGKPEAVVRYEEGIAAVILEKIPEEDGQKKLQVGSSKAVFTLIEGDEEKEYWKTIAVHRANSRRKFQNKNQKQFGNNKGRFKKNWNKRHRGNRDGESEEPQSKRSKFDENNAENGESAETPSKKAKTEENASESVEKEPSTKKCKPDESAENAGTKENVVKEVIEG